MKTLDQIYEEAKAFISQHFRTLIYPNNAWRRLAVAPEYWLEVLVSGRDSLKFGLSIYEGKAQWVDETCDLKVPKLNFLEDRFFLYDYPEEVIEILEYFDTTCCMFQHEGAEVELLGRGYEKRKPLSEAFSDLMTTWEVIHHCQDQGDNYIWYTSYHVILANNPVMLKLRVPHNHGIPMRCTFDMRTHHCHSGEDAEVLLGHMREAKAFYERVLRTLEIVSVVG